jgi:hypothetical protein
MNSFAYYSIDGELLLSNALYSFPTLAYDGSIIIVDNYIDVSTVVITVAQSTGNISGPLLASNLIRTNNISIESTLLYFDVINRKIGIKTDIPTKELVVDNVVTDTLIANTASFGNLQFDTTIQNLLSDIYIAPLQIDPTIKVPNLKVNDILFTKDSISAPTLSFNALVTSDISIDTVIVSAESTLNSFTTNSLNIHDNIIEYSALSFNSPVVKFVNNGLVLSTGTSSNRPSVLENGLTRYNTTTTSIETYYNNWQVFGLPQDALSLSEVEDVMFMWSVILS